MTWNLSATIRASGRTSSTALRNGQYMSITTVSTFGRHHRGIGDKALNADSGSVPVSLEDPLFWCRQDRVVQETRRNDDSSITTLRSAGAADKVGAGP